MDFPISVPSVGLVGGKFVDENPLVGTPGSLIPAQWGNAVTDEILNVIVVAGLVPDEDDNTQLKQAIAAIIGANVPQATETVAGRAKVTTQALVTAGVDDSTIVSPKKFAVRLASGGPVVGSVRNGRMVIVTASASATYTADEVVVKAALAGQAWVLSGFNKPINLATTGVGGMDIGSSPISNFVFIYAIYNPTTGVSALLATISSTTEVYSGANMPTGYTSSALVAAHLTNGTGQLVAGYWRDRECTTGSINVLTTSTTSGTYASVPLGGAVPPNAKAINVIGQVSNTVANQTMEIDIAVDSNGLGVLICDGQPAVGAGKSNQGWVPIITSQQLYARRIAGGGTPTFTMTSIGYRI